MASILEHGPRRFEVMAYYDAVHDAQAVELAELTDEGLGPAVGTVLFPDNGDPADARVLLDAGDLPLPILTSFMTEVVREQRRIGHRDS